MKKILKTLLIVMLCALALFAITSCKPEPEYKDYTVTVIDEIGNPMNNVMVKLTDSEGNTKTRVTGKDGTAVFVGVLVGENTVKLEKSLSDAVILTEKYTLDENTTSLRAIVRDETKTQHISGAVDDNTYATNIGIGTYNIPAQAGKTTYLIFNANSRGTYKVSFSSDDSKMTVGHYGIPMYVQSTHTLDGAYDGKSFEIIVQDIATPNVIGLNCVNTSDAKLTIERIGDAPFDPAFNVPTVNVQMQKEGLEKCTLASGTLLTDFDVTNTEITVELREDGYYYTSDGKLIYLRLASLGDYSSYIDKPVASIYDIVGLGGYQMGGVGGSNFGGYVYEDNGDYKEKRIYNDMISSYYELCDNEPGVYPLTDELAEALKVHGDNAGWFDKTNENTYLFKVPVVDDNAWLFMCCTVE